MKLQQITPRQGLDTGAGTMPRVRPDPTLGRALSSVANAVGEVAAQWEEAEKKRIGFKAQKDFVQLGNELDMAMLEAERDMSEDGSGFTQARNEDFVKRSDAFLKSLPDELKEQYAPRLEALRGNHEVNAARKEYARRDQFYIDGVKDTADRLKNGVLTNPDSYEQANQALQSVIDQTGLNNTAKAKALKIQRGVLRQSALEGLAKAGRGDEARALADAWDAEESVNFQSANIHATDLPKEAQTLLNTISRPGIEGAGYNTLYGGGKFSGFADHPRKAIPIKNGPNKGKTSSAAGKYQFLAGTWDEAAQALGLKDFSPANQDRAAWWLAQRDYKTRTGGDLITDLQKGEFAKVRKGLAGKGNNTTWEGLQKISDQDFAGVMSGQSDRAPAQADWKKYAIGGAERADSFSSMKPTMQRNLMAFMQAADRELGEGLQVYSGYRSPELQAKLYKAALKKYGSEKAARKWVAPPGNSKHNTGEAADLKFNGIRIDKADPKVRAWIKENAPKYGLDVPMAHEPWQVELAGARGQATVAISTHDAKAEQQPSPAGRYSQFVEQQIGSFTAANNRESQAALGEYDLALAKGDAVDREDILADPRLKDSHKASLLRSLATRDEKEKELNAWRQQIAEAPETLNEFNADDQEKVDTVYESTVGPDGLFAKDPDTKLKNYLSLDAFVKETRIVPISAVEDIRKALASGKEEAVLDGLTIAGSLVQDHEAQLKARKGGAELVKVGREYDYYARWLGLTPQDTAQRFMLRQSVDFQNNFKARKAQLNGKEGLLASIDESSLADLYDDSIFGGDPEVGFTDAQKASLMLDYKNSIKEHFMDTGDWKLAQYLAKEDMTSATGLYGVTEVNGERVLMRYPPEKVYASYFAQGGSIEEFQGQVLEAVRDETAIRRNNFDENLFAPEEKMEVEPSDIGLVIDSNAEEQHRRGNPVYRIVHFSEGPDGERFAQMTNRYFQFDPDAAIETRRERAAETAKERQHQRGRWTNPITHTTYKVGDGGIRSSRQENK